MATAFEVKRLRRSSHLRLVALLSVLLLRITPFAAGELLFKEGAIAVFDPPTDTTPAIPTPGTFSPRA
jgi:hypothetical protein